MGLGIRTIVLDLFVFVFLLLHQKQQVEVKNNLNAEAHQIKRKWRAGPVYSSQHWLQSRYEGRLLTV
jgi:hypothetical protein